MSKGSGNTRSSSLSESKASQMKRKAEDFHNSLESYEEIYPTKTTVDKIVKDAFPNVKEKTYEDESDIIYYDTGLRQRVSSEEMQRKEEKVSEVIDEIRKKGLKVKQIVDRGRVYFAVDYDGNRKDFY